MADKNKKKARGKAAAPTEKTLPQNIVPVGERSPEDKNIYISQPAYKDIHRFTENKTERESGGMLVGYSVEEFGKTNIVIEGFIEARNSVGTPTTLTFTHETWDYVHRELEKKYPQRTIVGWIHTHPNFGIFLSENDRFIQDSVFKEENQVAYVVDPIRNEEGFFCRNGGRIERCGGFYIFDKTGVKIAAREKCGDEVKAEKKPLLTLNGIVLSAAIVMIIILAASTLSLRSSVAKLRSELVTVATTADQNFSKQQQEIEALQTRVDELEKSLGSTDGAQDETASDDSSVQQAQQ